MSNRIECVTLQHRRVSPASAEVWVVVEATRSDAGTEVRGRLTGPTCPGVETVQVAYPVRPMARPAGQPEDAVFGRVVIPEPNLWSAETPFAYEGTVELWQDGTRCDVAPVATSFRNR